MNFQFQPLDGDHCISTRKQVGKPEFIGSSIEIKPKKNLLNVKKVSDLCPRPIHHVNNIILNQSTGHLALWSTIGLSIVNPPLIISKASQFVDLNLGRNYIRKFVWGQDGSFHILTSDNRVHTYSDADTLESVNRFSIQ